MRSSQIEQALAALRSSTARARQEALRELRDLLAPPSCLPDPETLLKLTTSFVRYAEGELSRHGFSSADHKLHRPVAAALVYSITNILDVLIKHIKAFRRQRLSHTASQVVQRVAASLICHVTDLLEKSSPTTDVHRVYLRCFFGICTAGEVFVAQLPHPRIPRVFRLLCPAAEAVATCGPVSLAERLYASVHLCTYNTSSERPRLMQAVVLRAIDYVDVQSTSSSSRHGDFLLTCQATIHAFVKLATYCPLEFATALERWPLLWSGLSNLIRVCSHTTRPFDVQVVNDISDTSRCELLDTLSILVSLFKTPTTVTSYGWTLPPTMRFGPCSFLYRDLVPMLFHVLSQRLQEEHSAPMRAAGCFVASKTNECATECGFQASCAYDDAFVLRNEECMYTPSDDEDAAKMWMVSLKMADLLAHLLLCNPTAIDHADVSSVSLHGTAPGGPPSRLDESHAEYNHVFETLLKKTQHGCERLAWYFVAARLFEILRGGTTTRSQQVVPVCQSLILRKLVAVWSHELVSFLEAFYDVLKKSSHVSPDTPLMAIGTMERERLQLERKVFWQAQALQAALSLWDVCMTSQDPSMSDLLHATYLFSPVFVIPVSLRLTENESPAEELSHLLTYLFERHFLPYQTLIPFVPRDTIATQPRRLSFNLFPFESRKHLASLPFHVSVLFIRLLYLLPQERVMETYTNGVGSSLDGAFGTSIAPELFRQHEFVLWIAALRALPRRSLLRARLLRVLSHRVCAGSRYEDNGLEHVSLSTQDPRLASRLHDLIGSYVSHPCDTQNWDAGTSSYNVPLSVARPIKIFNVTHVLRRRFPTDRLDDTTQQDENRGLVTAEGACPPPLIRTLLVKTFHSNARRLVCFFSQHATDTAPWPTPLIAETLDLAALIIPLWQPGVYDLMYDVATHHDWWKNTKEQCVGFRALPRFECLSPNVLDRSDCCCTVTNNLMLQLCSSSPPTFFSRATSWILSLVVDVSQMSPSTLLFSEHLKSSALVLLNTLATSEHWAPAKDATCFPYCCLCHLDRSVFPRLADLWLSQIEVLSARETHEQPSPADHNDHYVSTEDDAHATTEPDSFSPTPPLVRMSSVDSSFGEKDEEPDEDFADLTQELRRRRRPSTASVKTSDQPGNSSARSSTSNVTVEELQCSGHHRPRPLALRHSLPATRTTTASPRSVTDGVPSCSSVGNDWMDEQQPLAKRQKLNTAKTSTGSERTASSLLAFDIPQGYRLFVAYVQSSLLGSCNTMWDSLAVVLQTLVQHATHATSVWVALGLSLRGRLRPLFAMLPKGITDLGRRTSAFPRVLIAMRDVWCHSGVYTEANATVFALWVDCIDETLSSMEALGGDQPLVCDRLALHVLSIVLFGVLSDGENAVTLALVDTANEQQLPPLCRFLATCLCPGGVGDPRQQCQRCQDGLRLAQSVFVWHQRYANSIDSEDVAKQWNDLRASADMVFNSVTSVLSDLFPLGSPLFAVNKGERCCSSVLREAVLLGLPILLRDKTSWMYANAMLYEALRSGLQQLETLLGSAVADRTSLPTLTGLLWCKTPTDLLNARKILDPQQQQQQQITVILEEEAVRERWGVAFLSPALSSSLVVTSYISRASLDAGPAFVSQLLSFLCRLAEWRTDKQPICLLFKELFSVGTYALQCYCAMGSQLPLTILLRDQAVVSSSLHERLTTLITAQRQGESEFRWSEDLVTVLGFFDDDVSSDKENTFDDRSVNGFRALEVLMTHRSWGNPPTEDDAFGREMDSHVMECCRTLDGMTTRSSSVGRFLEVIMKARSVHHSHRPLTRLHAWDRLLLSLLKCTAAVQKTPAHSTLTLGTRVSWFEMVWKLGWMRVVEIAASSSYSHVLQQSSKRCDDVQDSSFSSSSSFLLALSEALSALVTETFSTTLRILFNLQDVASGHKGLGLHSTPFFWWMGDCLGWLARHGLSRAAGDQRHQPSRRRRMQPHDVAIQFYNLACTQAPFDASASSQLRITTQLRCALNVLTSLLQRVAQLQRPERSTDHDPNSKPKESSGSQSFSASKRLGYDVMFLFPPLLDHLTYLSVTQATGLLQMVLEIYRTAVTLPAHGPLDHGQPLQVLALEDIRTLVRSTSPQAVSSRSILGLLRQRSTLAMFSLFLFLYLRAASRHRELTLQQWLPRLIEAADLVDVHDNATSRHDDDVPHRCLRHASTTSWIQACFTYVSLTGASHVIRAVRGGSALLTSPIDMIHTTFTRPFLDASLRLHGAVEPLIRTSSDIIASALDDVLTVVWRMAYVDASEQGLLSRRWLGNTLQTVEMPNATDTQRALARQICPTWDHLLWHTRYIFPRYAIGHDDHRPSAGATTETPVRTLDGFLSALVSFTATERHDVPSSAPWAHLFDERPVLAIALAPVLLLRFLCRDASAATWVTTTFSRILEPERDLTPEETTVLRVGLCSLACVHHVVYGHGRATHDDLTTPVPSSQRPKQQRPQENTMCRLFWSTLPLTDIAHGAFVVGLPAESSFFLHLQSQTPRPTQDPPFPLPHALNPPPLNVPPQEVELLVAATHCWGVGLPDAFHGTLSQWSAPHVLHVEAEHTHAHAQRLALQSVAKEKDIAQLPRPSVWTRLLSDTSCYPSDLGWKHCMGMLSELEPPGWECGVVTSLSADQRCRDRRAEYFWRLNRWEEADACCFAPEDTTPQERLLDEQKCFVQRHALQRALSGENDGGDVVDVPSTIVPESIAFHVANPTAVWRKLCQHVQWNSARCTDLLTETPPWVHDLHRVCHESPSLLDGCEPVVTFRRCLLSLLPQQHRRDATDGTAQGRTLLRYRTEVSRALKLQGLSDAALLEALRVSEDVQRHIRQPPATHDNASTDNLTLASIQARAEWEAVQGFWASGQHQRALYSGRALGERLQQQLLHTIQGDLTTTLDPHIGSIIASVGRWMFEAQWDSWDTVEKHYFLPVLDCVTQVVAKHGKRGERTPPSSADPWTNVTYSKPHLVYAEVLDSIIQACLDQAYSKDAAAVTAVMESAEEELRLHRQELSKHATSRKAGSTGIISGLEQEIKRLSKLVNDAKKTEQCHFDALFHMACRSIQHYCIWLKRHDTESGETLNLWFRWGPAACQKGVSLFAEVVSNQTFHKGFLRHFRHFSYQLAARLDHRSKEKSVQVALVALMRCLIHMFPFDCIFPLIQLKNGAKIPTDLRGYDKFAFEPSRILGANNVLQVATSADIDPQGVMASILSAADTLSDFFIHLANLKLDTPTDSPATLKLSRLPNYKKLMAAATMLPPPTMMRTIPPFSETEFKLTAQHASVQAQLLAYVQETLHVATMKTFDDAVGVTETGISRPKLVGIWDTDGTYHKVIVKGRDDLRQDAVMEQLFCLLNRVFESVPKTRERNFHIRTYQVVPLSPVTGLVEWVPNTTTLGHFLTGPAHHTQQQRPNSGAHCRYYPNDIDSDEARKRLQQARASYERNGGSGESLTSVLTTVYREICSRFHPVMDRAFMELFDTPKAWFLAHQRYSRSLALNSMINYLMGIGDRHANNILIDVQTGELIHIDFGVAFGKGEALPIPEVVPFRMTPDLVVALGPLKFDGPFRMNCEVVLEELRQTATLVLSVVEVFLYDSLYQWVLNPRKALETRGQTHLGAPPASIKALGKRQAVKVETHHQPKKETTGLHLYAETDSEGKNMMGKQALLQVRRKLLGLHTIDALPTGLDIWSHESKLTVTSVVESLLRQATDPSRLAMMFSGWSPWL